MYRILDLISEQGSGGLVDKIIIAQDSLRAFTNTICPGAYVSMTKVNFSALDGLTVKPVGIYGSKDEIVRLLSSLGLVDDHVAAQLVANHSEHSVSTPSLRSGLYIVRTTCEATSGEQLFLIYWPEDGTWDDSAPSSMKRNRVTFMRYLTKMCDQVTALVSPEHSRSIVWSEQEDDDALTEIEEDQDGSDRMFTFEVTKTTEQEETVKPYPGFKATSDHIAMSQPHPEAIMDVGLHKPRLLHGETTQGFMTISYLPATRITDVVNRKSIARVQLGEYLKNDSLRVNENLDANALRLLIDAGLWDRFPQLCKQWQQESADISSDASATKASTEASIKTKLKRQSPLLTRVFHWTLVDIIVEKFPTFTRDSFPYFIKSEQGNPGSQDPVEPAIVPSPLTNGSSEQECFDVKAVIRLYPEIKEEFRHTVKKLHIEKIGDRNFQTCKEQIYSRLRQFPELNMTSNTKPVQESFRFIGKGTTSYGQPKGLPNNSFNSFGPGSQFVDRMFKNAKATSSWLSDAQFLAELDGIEKLPNSKKVVADTRAAALAHFRSLLTKQTAALTDSALRIQIDTCLARVRREAASSEEQRLAESRKRFIAEINVLSQTGHHS
ncbi:hypothetical protein DFH29DRAFT_140617 [Suillus ampliporus]|nr:hypothetical protein DFH29DRAFT_140617 [Suillus ampliporus]